MKNLSGFILLVWLYSDNWSTACSDSLAFATVPVKASLGHLLGQRDRLPPGVAKQYKVQYSRLTAFHSDIRTSCLSAFIFFSFYKIILCDCFMPYLLRWLPVIFLAHAHVKLCTLKW